MGFNTTQSVTFETSAFTPSRTLRWRRAAGSSDILTPDSGDLARQGTSRVTLSDVVLDSSVTLEILDGNTLLLTFTLRHY